MMTPETRYANNGGAQIAFQVWGDGAVDLALMTWASGLEVLLEQPLFVEFLQKLTSFARVIRHDRRGIGLSDRLGSLPDLETQVDDLRAVLDASSSQRAAVVGMGGNFPLAAMFAATHPDRTSAVILYNARARVARADDYPWGYTQEELKRDIEAAEMGWGREDYVARELAIDTPSMSGDPGFVRWFAKAQRHWAGPHTAAELIRQWSETDVRQILSAIRAPTLILARDCVDPEISKYLASLIPGAELVNLPGQDSMAWVGDSDALTDTIQRFLGVRRLRPGSDSVLATVLFTDIVDSTKTASRLGDREWGSLIENHDRIVRATIARFRGREVDRAGDGFLITFDGPARAIRCACAVSDALRQIGIVIRAGLHTGECELHDDKLIGIAVHIGARVREMAEPGEVFVSSTVKDLVAGSGLAFIDRGIRRLKGVPGEWRIFAVDRS
jgi:class 3 adenylate cyclase